MKASDGSLFTTLLLFTFIAFFGYDLIVFTWGIESKPFALAAVVFTMALTAYATIDWGNKHPEMNAVDGG